MKRFFISLIAIVCSVIFCAIFIPALNKHLDETTPAPTVYKYPSNFDFSLPSIDPPEYTFEVPEYTFEVPSFSTYTFSIGEQESIAPSESSYISPTVTYIGNVNTHKFHRTSCSYLPDAKNQTYFYSYSAAITSGYDPCAHCDP